MGVIPGSNSGDGAAFVGLPGNPVAVFVTFVRVVRPLLLRLAGALPEPLIAMPARAAFSYQKRKGRREYVRVALRHAADGAIEAIKHAQDGAGVLTSLTETDGLAELSEDVTEVEPGSTVGFLPTPRWSDELILKLIPLIPAKAGISYWVPAFAGTHCA